MPLLENWPEKAVFDCGAPATKAVQIKFEGEWSTLWFCDEHYQECLKNQMEVGWEAVKDKIRL